MMKLIHKNKYVRILFSACTAFLLVVLPAVSSAFYVDDEFSGSNSFGAASFDVLLTDTAISDILGPGLVEEIDFDTILLNTSSGLAPQYSINTAVRTGTSTVCDALILDAQRAGYSYTGPLLDFVAPTTTVLGTWEFDIELDTGNTSYAHGDTCAADILFNAWRNGVDIAESGFLDQEIVTVDVTAHTVVLNEFLPNPDGVAYGFDFGSDSSDMPQGEWVELYNNSDIPTDLTGWYIWDASGAATNKIAVTAANTIPATTTIPANGWLVVYMNKAVLNNSAETITLHDATDAIIDEYSYGNHDLCLLEPTPNATNTFNGGVGSCPPIPPNKSYARIPDGIGSFVDPIPTPGGVNIAEEEVVATTTLEILTPDMLRASVTPMIPSPRDILFAITSSASTSNTVVIPTDQEVTRPTTTTEVTLIPADTIPVTDEPSTAESTSSAFQFVTPQVATEEDAESVIESEVIESGESQAVTVNTGTSEVNESDSVNNIESESDQPGESEGTVSAEPETAPIIKPKEIEVVTTEETII